MRLYRAPTEQYFALVNDETTYHHEGVLVVNGMAFWAHVALTVVARWDEVLELIVAAVATEFHDGMLC